MERTNFFSGQEVEADDLTNITDTLSNQLKNRTIDFFTKGVVGSNSNYVVNDSSNKIKINPFIAYTSEGERIDVYQEIRGLAKDLTKPTEYRLCQQGSLKDDEHGWEIAQDYDIYVGYICKPARPRAHTQTGEFYPTRYVSGFEFYAYRPVTDDALLYNNLHNTVLVRLCRLNYDGTNVVITTDGYIEHSTIDSNKIYTTSTYTQTATYNPTTDIVNLEDHIFALGSGTPSPTNPHGLTPKDIGFEDTNIDQHEQTMHTSGIIANRDAYNSAFFIAVNNTSTANVLDTLEVYNLSSLLNEKLQVNGNWLSSFKYSTLSSIHLRFNDGTWPNYVTLPSGNYTIGILPTTGALCVGSDAGVGRTIRVTETAATVETGTNLDTISIVSMTDYAGLGAFDLAKFEFSDIKKTSYITTQFATSFSVSNFINKWDLRKFGSTGVSSLETTKEGLTNVLTLPYKVTVNSLALSNGAIIDGTSQYPEGYIQGFNVVWGSANAITVTPGYCKDSTGVRDIKLTQNLNKYIDRAWVPGGTNSRFVGGLQNSPTNPSLLVGGISLHVFVIMTNIGDVDIAIDTSITAENIRNVNASTYTYTYYRRIATLYLSHLFTETPQEILAPFTTVTNGNGLFVLYSEKKQLLSSVYDATTFTFAHTYVPSGRNFIAKFAYGITQGLLNIRRPIATQSLCTVNGYGECDIPVPNQTITTTSAFDFANNTLYCVGYYDSRSIL